MKPFCYSERCAKNKFTTKPTPKAAPLTAINCPDCNSTLVWIKSNNYLLARRKQSKKVGDRLYMGA